jgi:hypothetical protein
MIGLLFFLLSLLTLPFRSNICLAAENAVLRYQFDGLAAEITKTGPTDERWTLIQLYRWFPSILQV